MKAFLLFLACADVLQAHVGSPDVFFEGRAGPYPVSLSIRPPAVIPGTAEVEIRVGTSDVRAVKVVPLPLTGIGSKLPPTPDLAVRSARDPNFFTASVWLMGFGSYQVRVQVEGPRGVGSLSVPVPAIARETKTMRRGLGAVLAALMLLIVVGAVSIVGAAVREARLPAGQAPDATQLRRSRTAMTVTASALVAILALGYWWWRDEAGSYNSRIYKPLLMQASVAGSNLRLQLTDPGWALPRKLDDFLPDHGHLMHLFVIRMPEMDRMWHLHPEFSGNGEFTGPLPSLPAGHYKLFADIVHASGFPETPVGEITLPDAPDTKGQPLSGDDAEGTAPPLTNFDPGRMQSPLRDGYRMVRLPDAIPLQAKQLHHFAFEVQDPTGRPATDLQPYMGMAAHAEFISADGSIFAHVHPSGTVPMAALGLTAEAAMPAMRHSGRAAASIPAQISFPFGFPKPGRYRVFIQVERAGHPETASFDFLVPDGAVGA